MARGETIRKWFIKSTSVQWRPARRFYKLPNDFQNFQRYQLNLCSPLIALYSPTIGQMKWSSCRTDGITTFPSSRELFRWTTTAFHRSERDDFPTDPATFFFADEKGGRISWKRTPRRRTMPRVKIEGTGHVFVEEEIPLWKEAIERTPSSTR